mgnify:CR=1 FL=1
MTDEELTNRIAAMTLEEKALQLTQYPADEIISEGEKIVTGICNLGSLQKESLWRTGSTFNAYNVKTVRKIRDRRKAKGNDDPMIFMSDVIHGYRTIFPVPLGLACSFDMLLIENCAFAAATEAGYDGVDVTFSPMVDLVRDARWGRVMESGGEDPYLNGEIGKAFIRGYHKGGIGACVKHFACYGAAEAGREYNTTDISERSLKEYYMRAYRACLDENPEMFMSSFNLLNGKPILGRREIMIDMLRREWGFDGVLVSDFGEVEEMYAHGYAATGKECARIAAENELDIEMSSSLYAEYLPTLVREGVISESLIDRLVMRVLRLKDKLGMYENPDRYASKENEVTSAPTAESRNLARIAAEESCVLLKNNGVLPLEKQTKIALIGPFAEEKEIIGNWYALGRADEAVSIKDGVEKLLSRSVPHAPGCSYKLFENDESGFEAAVRVCENAEAAVICVGEYMRYSGEAHARADIRIPRIQRKLIERVKKTGKKTVLVVFGGRPLALRDVEDCADAILYVWQPGTEGGNAIANLLYGKTNPSGKTTMSFPRSVGQCPIYYNHFSTGRPRAVDLPTYDGGEMWRSGYEDEYSAPLYPFGYGLSYTTFAYRYLRLSKSEFRRGEKITASVTVANTGSFAGKETVQWYLHDSFASVVRPVKELKGFEKISLQAGEQKIVTFEIDEETLKFYTDGGDYAAENGSFELYVGGNSRDCLKAEFTLL